jgi:hypothetical protein
LIAANGVTLVLASIILYFINPPARR